MQKQREKLKAEIEVERSKQEDPDEYAAVLKRVEQLRTEKCDLQGELEELHAVDPARYKEMKVSLKPDCESDGKQHIERDIICRLLQKFARTLQTAG